MWWGGEACGEETQCGGVGRPVVRRPGVTGWGGQQRLRLRSPRCTDASDWSPLGAASHFEVQLNFPLGVFQFAAFSELDEETQAFSLGFPRVSSACPGNSIDVEV